MLENVKNFFSLKDQKRQKPQKTSSTIIIVQTEKLSE